LEDSAHILSIEDEPATAAMTYLQNLGNVERITLRMKNNFTSIVRFLHPQKSNPVNLPVIYHGGHGGVFWEDRYLNRSGRPYSVSVIDFLLGKGYDVVCVDMPLTDENTCAVPVLENGEKYIFSHDDIFQLQQPVYYFFEPVRRIIDFLEEQRGYEIFSMVGLSGGAWTTTLYSALDTRIVQSFSIAGSVPLPFRLANSDAGDEEQHNETTIVVLIITVTAYGYPPYSKSYMNWTTPASIFFTTILMRPCIKYRQQQWIPSTAI
jgi:pimeloyl-ACP methyl ester carboxylesterase